MKIKMMTMSLFLILIAALCPIENRSHASAAVTPEDQDSDGLPDFEDLCPMIPAVSCINQEVVMSFPLDGIIPERTFKSNPDEDASRNMGLLVAKAGSNRIATLVGQGDGTFEQTAHIRVGQGPISIATADFNGDGLTDAVVANFLSDSLSLAFGQGGGTFGPAVTYRLVANRPSSLVVGDFNRDGQPDVAVANAQSNSVTLLFGRGDGTLVRGKSVSVSGTRPSSLTAADLNSDGKLDLAVTNLDTDDVSILMGDDDGGFVESLRVEVGAGPIAIVAGDFDRNGRVDLAAANFHANTLSFLLSQPSKRFLLFTRLDVATGEGPTALAPGEYLSGKSGIAVANLLSHDVSIIVNDGKRFFPREAKRQAIFHPTSLTSGDFNGDSQLDLVIASPSAPTTLLAMGERRFLIKR